MDLKRIKDHFTEHNVEKDDYWMREEETIRVDINAYLSDARGPPMPPQALTVVEVRKSEQGISSPDGKCMKGTLMCQVCPKAEVKGH